MIGGVSTVKVTGWVHGVKFGMWHRVVSGRLSRLPTVFPDSREMRQVDASIIATPTTDARQNSVLENQRSTKAPSLAGSMDGIA